VTAHKTALERWKNQLLKERGWDAKRAISKKMRTELRWWSRVREKWARRPMEKGRVHVRLQTDAGPLGWAATWRIEGEPSAELVGAFGPADVRKSSNVREMKAFKNALKSSARSWRGQHLEWTTDSVVAARYMKKIHGKHDHLVKLAKQINEILWKWSIRLSIRVMKGVEIEETDHLSRLHDKADWELARSAWLNIVSRWGTPTIDMFASRFSAKTEAYVTRTSDSQALWTDAFASTWAEWDHVYAFPPLKLALRTVAKVVKEEVPVATLVLPSNGGAWTPWLQSITVDQWCLPWGAVRDTVGRPVEMKLSVYLVSGLLLKRESA
jgi:hypothetical protein